MSEAEGRGEVSAVVHDGLAWVTVARPEKKNALTLAMWNAIPGVMGSLAGDDEVLGVVIRGAKGDFGAGADLEDVLAATDGRARAEAYCRAVVTALLAVATLPLPTLALVDGVAAGGAAELALACDMRVAQQGASFSFPFARLGVVPDRFTLARLTALVGLSAARRVVFSGEPIDAAHALTMGLVDDVVPDGTLSVAASAWAKALSRGSRRTRAAIKGVFLESEPTRDVAALIGPMVDSFVSGEVREAALRFLGRT
jgi:enoyl-CoA hydratase/carnithine racemase